MDKFGQEFAQNLQFNDCKHNKLYRVSNFTGGELGELGSDVRLPISFYGSE